MTGKRPIDLLREGAGSAKTPPECGNIVTIFGCERQQRMYALGETGISSGVFADKIDPARTNPSIPRIVQKVELEFGANTEFVQQTVGLAMTLFKRGSPLPEGFDSESAFLEALSVAKDLGEISDTIRELSRSEASIRAKLMSRIIDMSRLPRTQNLRGRANQCIGHLASVRTTIVRLTQMFYPKQKGNEGWSEALQREFEALFPEGDERLTSLLNCISYLSAVLSWRNALEHP